MTDRVTPGERLAGIAGLVLLLVMFLFAWFGVSEIQGLDAFDAFDDWVNIILVFTSFAAMSLALFGTGVARVPAPMSTITTVLGAVSSVILIIYLISPPGIGAEGISVDLGRKFGVWLGLASAIAVTIGGYMAMQEEGTTFDEAADRLSRRPRTTEPGAAAPPPPPPPSSTGPGGPPASA
jgi:hypothetical protein